MNSCLRTLLEGLTFTIAGHPEHLPTARAQTRETSLRNLGLRYDWVGQIRNSKEIPAGPRRPDASMTKGITEAGGGVFAYFERLSLSMHIAAPS